MTSSRSRWRRASTTRWPTPRARASARSQPASTPGSARRGRRDPAAVRAGRAAARAHRPGSSRRRTHTQGAHAARRGRSGVAGRHSVPRPAGATARGSGVHRVDERHDRAAQRARGSTTARCEASARLSDILSAYHDVRLMPVPFAHAGYMNKLWDQVEFVISCVLTATPWTAESMLDADGAPSTPPWAGECPRSGRSWWICRSWPTPTSPRCACAPPGRRR